tara:strand:+ start:242 stop:403 length:162 start_codon:yes stop_codon:yes gene_type:complete
MQAQQYMFIIIGTALLILFAFALCVLWQIDILDRKIERQEVYREVHSELIKNV